MVNRAILKAKSVVVHPTEVTKAMLNKQLAELTYVTLQIDAVHAFRITPISE